MSAGEDCSGPLTLEYFSEAGKLPCVLRVSDVRDKSVSAKLAKGAEIVILSIHQEDAVLLRQETEKGKVYMECNPDAVDVGFVLLESNANLDNKKFESVADIMRLDKHERPKFVRAEQGWFEDVCIDMDEILGVGSAVEEGKWGQILSTWFKVHVPEHNRTLLTNLESYPSTSVRLKFNTACSFSCLLDPKPYSLSDILQGVNANKLQLPLRLMVENSKVPACTIGSKYSVDGVVKVPTIVGMITGGPSAKLHKERLFRIPVSTGSAVTVEELSEWRPSIGTAIEEFMKELTISKLPLIRNGSMVSITAPPPIPGREPIVEGDRNIESDDSDEYAYTYIDNDLVRHPQPKLYPPGTSAESTAEETSDMQVNNVYMPSEPTSRGGSGYAMLTGHDRPPIEVPIVSKQGSFQNRRLPAPVPSSAKPTAFNPAADLKFLASGIGAAHDKPPASGGYVELANPQSAPASPRLPRRPSPEKDAEVSNYQKPRVQHGASTLKKTWPRTSAPETSIPLAQEPSKTQTLPFNHRKNSKPQTPPTKPRAGRQAATRSLELPSPAPRGTLLDLPMPPDELLKDPGFDTSLDGLSPEFPPPPCQAQEPPPSTNSTTSLDKLQLIERLRSADLGKYEYIFRTHNLDGKAFSRLNDSDLRFKFGISSNVDRQRLLSIHDK